MWQELIYCECGVHLKNICGLSTWVCVSVIVYFFVLIACVDSFRGMLYIQGETFAGCVLDKGQVRGSAEGIWWSGRWSQEVSEGSTAFSRGGRTFLSPPKGCSSSALGSGKDPPGRHPLSTLPSCEWGKQSSERSLIQNSSLRASSELKAGQKALHCCDSVIINMVLYDFCLAYLQYDVIISTGHAAKGVTLDGFVGCSSVPWFHFGHIKAWFFTYLSIFNQSTKIGKWAF